MKCFTALLAVASVLAFASTATLDELPGCAMDCVLQALATGKCSGGDLQCTCTDPDFLETTKACLTNTCSSTEIAFVSKVKKNMCAEYTKPTTPTPPTNATGSSYPNNRGGSTPTNKNDKPEPGSKKGTPTYTTGNYTTPTGTGAAPTGTDAAPGPTGTGVPHASYPTNSTPPTVPSSGTGKVSVVFSFVGLGLLTAFVI